MQKLQQGAIGVTLRANLVDQTGKAVDLTGAETTELVLLPPRGAAVTVTAVANGDLASGSLEYVTTAGDLPTFGVWKFQPHAIRSAPSLDVRGLAIVFEVVANLDG